jgi:hypothetical protein
MPVYALSNDQVIALAKQKAQGHVKFIAIDYNWGPPISGRSDTDWMHLWGVSSEDSERGTLWLQGTRWDYKWDLNIPFSFILKLIIENEVEYFLYYLALPGDFPIEFVLRFDTVDGPTYYDNNHGKNYKIPNSYQGRGLSALGTVDAIFDFDRILPCHLYWPTYPP